MIFKISKDKDFFDENPSALWIKEFKDCSSEEMKYVVLCYSYDSPFRTLPSEQKKIKSLDAIGISRMASGKFPKEYVDIMENKIQRVRNAILKLRDITRDEDKETLEAYDEQLDQFRALMRKRDKSDKEMDQAMKISKEFPSFLENRQRVKEILDIRDDSSQQGLEQQSEEFSTVEDFLSNE
jgi:hypothetical protein